MAVRALSPFACKVSETTNGYNALFAMEKALPDLLLLDVSMPIMDGLELLTMMRAHDSLKGIPVIMLTSPADHTRLATIEALGVSGIIRKPFNEAALMEKIQPVLNLAPSQPARG